MNTRLLVALLGAGSLAFACGPRTHTEASANPSAVADAQTVQKPKRRGKPQDGKIESQLHVLRAGDELRFAIQVSNAGNKAIELTFPDGQTHEVVVVDSLGRELWRWSEGRMFTQAMRNSVIGGGDTLAYEERWARPEAHGTLTAVATLRSTNYPVEHRVAFVLP